MPLSIGINLRVTGHCSKGGRKYMEDFFSVAYQQTDNDQSLEYAFFGIYDGHGGSEAATFAKEHLMNSIVNQKLFWSDDDDDVLKAIKEGYINTHYSMWREQDKWPKTSSGLPSTAGTTASIAFIRRGKIYIGHVGDSGIILGYQKDDDTKWGATPLTEDHKPESYVEKTRIMNCGGKVVTKSGVPRVVWNRPRIGHKGPVRRSTPIDEIPFLAVARSLGDLWSYNSAVNEFVVSPNPDVRVVEIDPKKFRCLIFGTDGLWNVLSPKSAVDIVRAAEMENVRIALDGGKDWKNPSKSLVNEALERWSRSNMKADNTSVVIIMLDPPGPPKRDVIKSMKTTAPSIEYEPYVQPTDNIGIALFDHMTRETIDLSHIPIQEPCSSSELQHLINSPEYLEPTPSTCNHDMVYMDSFAESYNSLLNTSLTNDHSYTNFAHQQFLLQQHSQPHILEQSIQFIHDADEVHNPDETYSLTNLQTKSERLHAEMLEASSCSKYYCEPTGNVAIVENFHDYHQRRILHEPYLNDVVAKYQMERYDYIQGVGDVHPSCSYANPSLHVSLSPLHHDISSYVESTMSSDSEVEVDTNHGPNSFEKHDESIQINEISSSDLNLNAGPMDRDIAGSGEGILYNVSELSKLKSLKLGKSKSKIKKGIKSAVKFFYETRSKIQRRKIRSQENLSTPKFYQKSLSKNSKLQKFMDLKRKAKRKSIIDSVINSNNNNNNNSNNNNVSEDPSIPLEKRVLRSQEVVVPPTKPNDISVCSSIKPNSRRQRIKILSNANSQCDRRRQAPAANVLSSSSNNIITSSSSSSSQVLIKPQRRLILTRNRGVQKRLNR